MGVLGLKGIISRDFGRAAQNSPLFYRFTTPRSANSGNHNPISFCGVRFVSRCGAPLFDSRATGSTFLSRSFSSTFPFLSQFLFLLPPTMYACPPLADHH